MEFEAVSPSISYNEVMSIKDGSEGLVESHLMVFAGSRGKVVAINSATGEIIWTYNCPGGYFKTPVIIVEPPNNSSRLPPYQVLNVGAGNWVYCLKAQTGGVLWSVKVSNIKAGLNYVTLATC